MPAGIAHSSERGNGEHRWLRELIAKIARLTIELQELAARIGLLTDPAENDVAEAYDRVSQLFALIVQEVIPGRVKLSQLASASSLPDLNEALESLQQSGQNALIAIDVYTKTLKNEQRQRARERRSNRRYADDQQSLQRLRYQATVEVKELIEASEGFVHVLS